MATHADLKDTLGASKKFNDPFLLNSNLYIPREFYTNLDLAAYLAAQFPAYTQATKRTVSHFITDILFTGDTGDTEEKDELKEYLTHDLDVMEKLQLAGMEYFIYGNSFIRIYFPFNRYLVDRRNGRYREYNVNTFGDDISFNLDSMTYKVPDPMASGPVSSRPKVDFEFTDRKCLDRKRISILLLDPRRMILHRNYISGNIEYIWRFDDTFVSDVRLGKKIWLINDTPKEILKAVRNNLDFKFNPDTIFHIANNFISGISYNGWGIPNILLNYQSIHLLAVLRNINEAVGLDYMLPIRLLSPAQSGVGGGSDAATALNMGPWLSNMEMLIEHKRKDPTAMHVVPFPVQFQELGGNGKALAPVELMKMQLDEMLDAFGYPAELWHMSLSTAEVPTAIRMFESTFTHLLHKLSKCLLWCNYSILEYLGQELIGIKLMPPTMADDLEVRHIYLLLAAGGEVSRQLAYKAFGVDNAVLEAKRRMEEDMQIQKEQQKLQELALRELELGSVDDTLNAMLLALQGAAPQGVGGAPADVGMDMSGGEGGATPMDVMNQADLMAQQLLSIQDKGERQKMMNKLRATKPTVYALAKQKMEEMRAAGASLGRKAVGLQG